MLNVLSCRNCYYFLSVMLSLSSLKTEEVTYSFIYFFVSFLKFLVSLFLRKCRYVGNIHTQVTEPLLQEVFASTGPVEGCKLIRKEKVKSSIFYLVFSFLLLHFLLVRQ